MTYFNANELPPPTDEFVAWLDVMGIQAAMSMSIKVAANFIFKLHIVALESKTDGIRLYPVMDGIYISSASATEIAAFLQSIFLNISNLFIEENNEKFRFLVRGAIAKGNTYHGANIGDNASWTLANNAQYRGQILLGIPMVQAHVGERKAPPFGVFVDKSARCNELTVSREGWWRWFDNTNGFNREALLERARQHYSWCYANSDTIGYEPDRILVHKGLADIYFAETQFG